MTFSLSLLIDLSEYSVGISTNLGPWRPGADGAGLFAGNKGVASSLVLCPAPHAPNASPNGHVRGCRLLDIVYEFARYDDICS